MADRISGKIHEAGPAHGVGVLSFESGTKCILYYRSPDSEINHAAGEEILFVIRDVEVVITKADTTTYTSPEQIAVLVRMEGSTAIEEIDPEFESGGGLPAALRMNDIGTDDPPKAGVPRGEENSYHYGKVSQNDEGSVMKTYYFDRTESGHGSLTAGPNRIYYGTRSCRKIDPNRLLNGSPGTTSIQRLMKNINTYG